MRSVAESSYGRDYGASSLVMVTLQSPWDTTPMAGARLGVFARSSAAHGGPGLAFMVSLDFNDPVWRHALSIKEFNGEI